MSPTATAEHDTIQRALRAVWGAVAWDDRHIRLSAHPLLDGLGRGQIRRWVQEDHLLNCVTMRDRLRTLGYTGGVSQLKAFVQPLRPPKAGHFPVRRYETPSGEQLQFDWGEFVYEHEGKMHKFYGFTAILGYSRMRFVTFVKRCDTPTLIRCLMEAFEYFGGLTRVALTDRMKSVLLEMEENLAIGAMVFHDPLDDLLFKRIKLGGPRRTRFRDHRFRVL